MAPKLLFAFLAGLCMPSSHLLGDDEISPGKVVLFSFPGLPPTLYSTNQPNKVAADVAVRLPDDYSREKSFPLLVYLQGGDGGDGKDLSHPLSIVGKTGWIVASFPLFKAARNNEEPWGGIRVGFEDHRVMSEAYRAILERLRQAIPNIDREKSLLGGYSNGGHAVAMLLSTLDENVLKSFGGFFILDSGIDWTSYAKTKVLKNHHILFVAGAGRPANDEWWRESMVSRIQYFAEVARQEGMSKWTFVVLKDAGHDGCEKYFPAVRQWIKKMDGT
jgi:predicted esterase